MDQKMDLLEYLEKSVTSSIWIWVYKEYGMVFKQLKILTHELCTMSTGMCIIHHHRHLHHLHHLHRHHRRHRLRQVRVKIRRTKMPSFKCGNSRHHVYSQGHWVALLPPKMQMSALDLSQNLHCQRYFNIRGFLKSIWPHFCPNRSIRVLVTGFVNEVIHRHCVKSRLKRSV